MAKPDKLKEIEREYNEPLESLIPRVVAEEGSISGAAARFRVAANTIHNWVKNNGYRLITRQVATLEKEEPTPEPA
jgi:hypothetical protein